MRREELSPEDLDLPICGLPRPGDRVVWYQDRMPIRGTLIGHKLDGRPCIRNDFDNLTILDSFDFLRLDDPTNRIEPNWTRLPTNGKILRPFPSETEQLSKLLSQHTPPGPQYIDLVSEIWSRGHEIFVVGGTVRDVIGGHPSKDVDLVTTMPLIKAKPLLESMYRYRQNRKKEERALANGHLRLGGRYGSGDPFIDLCVFKYSLPGDPDATFSADFQRDVGHRDFACNSVYYDPKNDCFIDPTGVGVHDAERRILTLVCDKTMRNSYHLGQIMIRFFKFLSRGFVGSTTCCSQVNEQLVSCLSSMDSGLRTAYVHTQILSKYPKSEYKERFEEFHSEFIKFGVSDVWDHFIEPYREVILDDER